MAETTPTGESPAPDAGTTELPYPSVAFPLTHPDRLAAIGRLFGVETPLPASARVLELACGDGANLLPMAQLAPQGKFVGVESSEKLVAAAKAAIEAAGLKNVEIICQEIEQFDSAGGQFDYIVLNDVFSFVAPSVRTKLLALCCSCLAPTGVAFISYNTFPGWGMRMALREMLLIHTRGIADPKQKVRQARALMTFLADAVPTENNPYGLLLKQEVERMSQSVGGYWRHQMLEEINQPFYFHEFVGQAAEAGLQYLGEPVLDQMLGAGFPAKVQETLAKTGNNIVVREQYMDFLRNQAQRHTLLVHRGVQLNRQLAPAALRGFYFSSLLTRVGDTAADFAPGVEMKFGIRGSEAAISLKDALPKALFDSLTDTVAGRVSVDDILESMRTKAAVALTTTDSAELEKEVLRELLQLCMRGVVDIFAGRPQVEATVPAKPVATPLARHQATQGRQVTNRVHMSITFDGIGRYVISLCDGAHDRDAIVASLVQAIKEGKLKAAENNQPITDEKRIREIMGGSVAGVLDRATKLGFFANQAG